MSELPPSLALFIEKGRNKKEFKTADLPPSLALFIKKGPDGIINGEQRPEFGRSLKELDKEIDYLNEALQSWPLEKPQVNFTPYVLCYAYAMVITDFYIKNAKLGIGKILNEPEQGLIELKKISRLFNKRIIHIKETEQIFTERQPKLSDRPQSSEKKNISNFRKTALEIDHAHKSLMFLGNNLIWKEKRNTYFLMDIIFENLLTKATESLLPYDDLVDIKEKFDKSHRFERNIFQEEINKELKISSATGELVTIDFRQKDNTH